MTDDPTRTPSNGRPFYCAKCGAGWNEYMACEMPDCTLESVETAQERQRDRQKADAALATAILKS